MLLLLLLEGTYVKRLRVECFEKAQAKGCIQYFSPGTVSARRRTAGGSRGTSSLAPRTREGQTSTPGAAKHTRALPTEDMAPDTTTLAPK